VCSVEPYDETARVGGTAQHDLSGR
jgi:hypothetical protein